MEAGHEVVGTHNSPASAQLLEVLGAEPVRLDLLDAAAVRTAVLDHQPDAIVHQATALTGVKFGRNLDKTFATTNRLRTEGTDALLAPARAAGVRRFVAQSVALNRYARQGGPVKTETDPLEETPPTNTGKSLAAITHLEKATLAFGGIALRYGGFYGAANDAMIEPVRKHRFPIVGDGGGITSWMHLDDGAAATVAALEHAGPAIYNIVDDEPAPVRDWLPVLADALGAKPPRHAPTRLDSPIPQLARGFPGHLLGDRGRRRACARPRHRTDPVRRLSTCPGRSTNDHRRPSATLPAPRRAGSRSARAVDQGERADSRSCGDR